MVSATPPRNFLVLVFGYSCSAYGNYLNLIALSLFTLAVTGSPLGVGVVMALRLGAGFGAGLVAGRLVTRFDRRRLMVGTDLAQALAMVVLAVAPTRLPVLIGVAVVLGAGNTLFTVALRSSVPEMVGQDARVRANGLLVSGRAAGTILGYSSAGLIVAAGGFDAAFLINAASFLVSAAALARLRLPTSAVRERPDGVPGSGAPLVALVGPLLAVMVLVRGGDAFGSAAHNVALPLYASEVDPAHPAFVMSQFWGAWAVGSLLAHQVVRRWSGGAGERAFALGTCLMSVCFVSAFLVPVGPLLMGVALLAGLADGCTEIGYTSRLQEAPDELRGRLFARSATAETCGFATGMMASSALLEVLAVPVVVVLFHSVAAAGAVGLLITMRLVRSRSLVR